MQTMSIDWTELNQVAQGLGLSLDSDDYQDIHKNYICADYLNAHDYKSALCHWFGISTPVIDDTADCQEDDYDIYSDVLRLQGMGLLDKDGMPTDAFFEWCD